jgi:hypothetical protein
MATLYEIKAEMEQAISEMLATADEETGEVSAEAMARFTELQVQKEEKLDNLGAYYKNLLAEAKMLKEEEQSLKARREAKERKAENIKNYLAMILDGEKFESPRVACSWRKSESVAIDDAERLPEEYTISKVTVQPDKAKIKEAIKSGAEIDGARLEVKNNLQVK